MSLLTPPNTSHRSDKDKENNFRDLPIAGPSTRSVVWAPKDIIHTLGTPLKHVTISSRSRPSTSRSILKAPRENEILELPALVSKRETTPEPSDPLVDLNYLDYPVNQILSNGTDDETSLGQLIEGYNVLAARLRACISESTDADASWPIFQPLRKNTQAFTDAVVRDVKRALVDPLSYKINETAENAHKLPQYALPSPANSPTKKKGGMSEEQVKYARDLCTTCHSVLKLLSAVLSLPAIYNVFEEKQLGEMLTAILAIPLADDLPTPNARKSCALSIWVIQVQRLPTDVLRPAASRIAYALRRGLDGELGKEGKKGSANDGLKAIHDLCVYLPAVFIPAFTPLLSSVLSNLLAPTLALRTQACHALGGFVNGSVAIPTSTIHTKISNTVAAYLNTASPSPGKVAKSPTKPTEAAIVRTLRTTLNNVEPTHVATGPVWALSVLASFVVLLGSRLSKDQKVNHTVSALLSLGIRHKKSSIRALTCVAWRPIAWSYIQPPLPVDEDDEDETLESEFNHELNLRLEQARLAHCKVMLSVVDCQAGVSTIAGLLGDNDGELRGSESLRLTIEILQSMTLKAGHTCRDAIEAFQHLVSGGNEDVDSERFDMKLLVPSKLFSANPGLLTTDFKNLSSIVRVLFEQVAMVNDIRKLKRSEIALPPVFRGLMAAWCTALGCLEMDDGAELPDDLAEIWTNLLQANVGYILEKGAGLSSFASSAAKYIIHVVQDPKLNLMPQKVTEKFTSVAADTLADSDDTIPEYKGNNICTNGELRMRVVQRMWSTMAVLFPHDALRECADSLLSSLMKNENLLIRGTATPTMVEDDEAVERARAVWVSLCVDVLHVCETDAMNIFWGCEEDLSAAIAAGRRSPSWSQHWSNMVWKTFVERWSEVGGDWEGGVVLLGVPFMDRYTWGLVSEDYALWEQLLQHATSKALDHGLDTYVVLDNVASLVSSFQTPGASPASSLRLVDLLLSNLDVADMRELPTNIVELASEIMCAIYPPEPRFRHYAMWVLRSLTTVIEHCPKDFGLQLLQDIQEGLCLWLADQNGQWTETEFTYDIIPLYQHIILKVQDLPESVDTLDAAAPILDSIFLHRIPTPAAESFTEFWNLAYAHHSPPADGWTGPIRHCLGAVGIMPMEEVTQNATFPLAPAFVAQPSSPRTPVSASFSTPPTAIIRREALSRVQSPQRPAKVYGSFPIVPCTPPSPVNRRHSRNSSVNRTPLSAIQVGQASPKRRRLITGEENGTDDKENSAAIVDIPSVADRIAGLSIPNMKKRRFEDDDEDEEQAQEKPALMSAKLKGKMKAKLRPAKKARIPSPAPSFSSNESEDERWVEEALKATLPFPPLPETPSQPKEDPVSCRTRGSLQRAIRSSVTKPTSQTPAKKGHAISLDTALHTPMRKLDLTKMSLRRSTSIPENLLKSSETTVAGAKRKWAASAEGAAEGSVTRIRIGPPRHAKKRSYYSFSSSDGPEQQQRQVQSSDDDPHYGQVTPHHLISPAMPRRAGSFSGRLQSSTLTRKHDSVTIQQLFDADGEEDDRLPGSDDSVATSESGSEESPTKEFVTRQLRRTSSTESIFKGKKIVSFV